MKVGDLKIENQELKARVKYLEYELEIAAEIRQILEKGHETLDMVLRLSQERS